MQYPNRRYGNPTAMAYYALAYGDDVATIAKALRRSKRSVSDWLSGRARVPWWVPEIMRLQIMERDNVTHQMTGRRVAARLGVVTDGAVVDAGLRFRATPLAVEVTPASDGRDQLIA